MNRKQRRRLSQRAPHEKRKEIQQELKRRGTERYSEACMFERHDKCVEAGCGCPHHTHQVDGDEKLSRRDSGIFVPNRGLYVYRDDPRTR